MARNGANRLSQRVVDAFEARLLFEGDGVRRARAVTGRPIRAHDSAALRYAARPTLGGEPPHDRDGVIRLQRRRKISSTLIRNTVVPSPFARLWEAVWRWRASKSP